ncbi:hypothetical protein D6817_02705 [Candidatus Pacearchaeota archaeon]|nr:MAG: hypothetical protein D6817_02705 [Candidatus Pacearchaeota archaeon]
MQTRWAAYAHVSPQSERIFVEKHADMREQQREQQPENDFALNRKEKIRLYVLAFIILLLSLGEMFGVLSLTMVGLTGIIIAVLLFSIEGLPKYVKSIKVGDFAIELRQINQQQKFIFELQQQITDLERRIDKTIQRVDKRQEQRKISVERFQSRFERAARNFNINDKAARILAEQEMIFTGVRLGKDFLERKLRDGSLGERAGAASALGFLGASDVIKSLTFGLNDKSSFVRYRAAQSIERIADILDEEQIQLALQAIESAISRETNANVSQVMLSTAYKLRRREKTLTTAG